MARQGRGGEGVEGEGLGTEREEQCGVECRGVGMDGGVIQ